MLRRGLFLFVAGLLAAGFLACPVPQEQSETPPNTDQPTAGRMIADIQAKCICANCPSWTPACAEAGERGGYCSVGKSACITAEKGCICADCPITKEKGLKRGYYCTRGSDHEMQQMESPAGEQQEGGS
jgi:hypothetical protein